MTPPTRAGTLRVCSLAAATAALVFGPAAPALCAGDDTAPGDGLQLSPASATAGTPVDIRADCAGDGRGTVFSPAFASAAPLRPAAGTSRGSGLSSVARAVVKSGLPLGKRYAVTADCAATGTLTTTFVHAGGGRTDDPAAARTEDAADGSASGEDRDTRGGRDVRGVGNAALAIGGGLATAGLAGYVLTVRRGGSGSPGGSGGSGGTGAGPRGTRTGEGDP